MEQYRPISKCEIRKDGRVCVRCSKFYLWGEYWKDNRDPNGRSGACKTCTNTKRAAIRATLPKSIKPKKSPLSPEIVKQRKREYGIKYREDNREKQILYFKNRYARDKKNILAQSAIRRKDEDFKLRVNKNRRDRLKTDDLFRFKTVLRNRLRLGFKARGLSKERRTIEYLGMSYPELRVYIESKFLIGMTWENYGIGKGKWNLDHILPLSLAKTQEDLLKLCHYSNLQPLWAIDNLLKNNKVPHWYKNSV